jgi:hypothetical protein
MTKKQPNIDRIKSLESWIWDAACSIRGAQAQDIVWSEDHNGKK